MVVFGQNGCIRAKVVVFGQSSLISILVSKVVVLVSKVVVFGEKWFYSHKVAVFGQSRSIREKWMYSAKVVVLGQK